MKRDRLSNPVFIYLLIQPIGLIKYLKWCSQYLDRKGGMERMITKLGVFLRKLRLDQGEILKNMADRLEVSTSFLSAVENGKKRVPQRWYEEIPKLYSFEESQTEQFLRAIADTEQVIEINLSNLSSTKQDFAFSLARKIETIDEDVFKKMMKDWDNLEV